MNQADVTKLMSQLRFAIAPRKRLLKNPQGPEGRLLKIRKTVTALIKHERIELFYNRADESRGYAELLISEAIRHGDQHAATMELADFYLLEKQLVHKLFKVLVPRFENCKVSYTRMYKAPREYPGVYYKRSVLELRGNPYPPLLPDLTRNRNFLHNILLDEAYKDFKRQQLAKLAEKMADKGECNADADADAVTNTNTVTASDTEETNINAASKADSPDVTKAENHIPSADPDGNAEKLQTETK